MTRGVPTWIDKVNTIVDFVEEPCHAPWYVYVELAIPALGEAVFDYFSFGWEDYVRGRIRPSNLRSIQHGKGSRGSRRKGKRGGGIPEIGEFIGESLSGPKSPYANQKNKYIFLLDAGLQRIGYYWMLADVGLNFLYNWTTALQQAEECQIPNRRSKLLQGVGHMGGGDDVWNSFSDLPVVYDPTGSGTGTVWSAGPAGAVVILSSSIGVPVFPAGPVQDYQTSVFVSDAGPSVRFESGTVDGGLFKKDTITVARGYGGANFGAYHRWDTGLSTIPTASFFAQDN